MLGKKSRVVVLSLLVSQLAGCGYILYPERRGQTGGRIDVGVAVLDAVGLLFFLVPGVIAFAVDFTSGTIYLPGGKHAGPDREDVKAVKVAREDLTERGIEAAILEHTGVTVKLDQPGIQTSELASLEEMKQRFEHQRRTSRGVVAARGRW